MTLALYQAIQAMKGGEVAVGCVMIAPATVVEMIFGFPRFLELKKQQQEMLCRIQQFIKTGEGSLLSSSRMVDDEWMTIMDDQWIVIDSGHNETNKSRNGTRHAELVTIDKIIALTPQSPLHSLFSSTILFVTVEPCIMCAAALMLIGLRDIVYGCRNDRFGGGGTVVDVSALGRQNLYEGQHCKGSYPCHCCNPSSLCLVEGVRGEEAVELLQMFYIRGNPTAPVPHRPVGSRPLT